jgi:opine dehydrogenase
MSLVPIASLGKRYGVSVRGRESLIQIASFIHHTDYWRRGGTLETLVLEQSEVSELRRFVQDRTIDSSHN